MTSAAGQFERNISTEPSVDALSTTISCIGTLVFSSKARIA